MEPPYDGLPTRKPGATNRLPQRHGQIHAAEISPSHRALRRRYGSRSGHAGRTLRDIQGSSDHTGQSRYTSKGQQSEILCGRGHIPQLPRDWRNRTQQQHYHPKRRKLGPNPKLLHSADGYAAESLPGSNPANGLLRSVLRAGSITTARPHQEGQSVPNGE